MIVPSFLTFGDSAKRPVGSWLVTGYGKHHAHLPLSNLFSLRSTAIVRFGLVATTWTNDARNVRCCPPSFQKCFPLEFSRATLCISLNWAVARLVFLAFAVKPQCSPKHLKISLSPPHCLHATVLCFEASLSDYALDVLAHQISRFAASSSRLRTLFQNIVSRDLL